MRKRDSLNRHRDIFTFQTGASHPSLHLSQSVLSLGGFENTSWRATRRMPFQNQRAALPVSQVALNARFLNGVWRLGSPSKRKRCVSGQTWCVTYRSLSLKSRYFFWRLIIFPQQAWGDGFEVWSDTHLEEKKKTFLRHLVCSSFDAT